MISSIIQVLFRENSAQYEWVRKEKHKESMIWLTPKPTNFFTVYNAMKKITEKELFKEKKVWSIEQKTKRRLFNCSCNGDFTRSIRKHANEL